MAGKTVLASLSGRQLWPHCREDGFGRMAVWGC